MNSTKPSRNPWPIAIVAYFAVFITFIAAFITFATRQREDLVRDDYYAQEIKYQDQINRLVRTRESNARLNVAYNNATHCVEIKLPQNQAGKDASGIAHLYRPSNAGLDREMNLPAEKDGQWNLNAPNLLPGLWKVRITWKIGSEEFFFDQSMLVADNAR
jgi:nitrogen fixation protein FixH